LETLGKHIILEMYGCKFEDLDNEQLILDTFKEAISKAKMTCLNLSSHKFSPQGVTALALLSESHMSIHTYPESGYAAADVFTCGEEGDPFLAMELFCLTFKPDKKTITYIPRGLEVK
jgi:S-adenosylmethionine decarboxylase